MKIMMILSPAKTLDMESTPPFDRAWTVPECNPENTEKISAELKKMSLSQIKTKLKLSDNLAKTAYKYWKEFNTATAPKRPCIFAYSGAAYVGLDAPSCSEDSLDYLQDRLRILSGVYGALRPYDNIQAYRLEMGTKEVLQEAPKSLADFWRGAVTELIANELSSDDDSALLNLASDEYAAALDPSAFDEKVRFIKIVFQEEGRVIAIHAKRARGMMVRYLAENQVDQLDAVKDFSEEGYSFDKDKSDSNTFVFDRSKQAKGPAKRKSTAPVAKKSKASKK